MPFETLPEDFRSTAIRPFNPALDKPATDFSEGYQLLECAILAVIALALIYFVFNRLGKHMNLKKKLTRDNALGSIRAALRLSQKFWFQIAVLILLVLCAISNFMLLNAISDLEHSLSFSLSDIERALENRYR